VPSYLDLLRVTTQTIAEGLGLAAGGRTKDETGQHDRCATDREPRRRHLRRDVTVTYRNGLTALNHASFQIPRGTVTALVGVNGAGKSTLFKAIMGFVPVAAGEIRLLGMTVREALRATLSPMSRRPRRWTGPSRCWSRTW
jgi:ABC-type transport system involved in cytochrome bd biosynthesis fused ATPase/permease subunit